MDAETDPMDPARAAASARIGRNALTLDRLAGERRRDRDPGSSEGADAAAEAAMAAAEVAARRAATRIAANPTTPAERAAARIGRAAIPAPGVAYDLGQIALAKDKARAAAGVFGGRIGAEVGEAVLPEGLVVGPIAGAVLGDQAGKAGFDIARDGVPRLMESIRRLPSRAETAFRGGLPPNSATLR